MNDFLYDLKRTFSGKFTIVSIILIILISVGIGLLFTSAASSSGSGPSVFLNESYTYSNGTYNVTFYAFDQYGNPAGALPVYTEHNGTFWTNETQSNGFLNLSIKSDSNTELLNYSQAPFNSTNHFGAQTFPMFSRISASKDISVNFNIIKKPGTTNSRELLIYYASTNTSQSQTAYLYYKTINVTSSYGSLTPSNMTYYTSLTTKGVGVAVVNINPPNLGAAQEVAVAAFSSKNATFALSESQYSPTTALSKIGIAIVSFDVFAEIFGLIIPILASFSAYFYFGKDRANAVLESVITRPVTKGRIILSRYTASVGSMIIAFAVGVGIFEIFLNHATGDYMTAPYVGSLIWTYLVEIAAFTGLIYLVSQFVKSQGGILGIAIAISLVFGILWSIIVLPLLLTQGFHLIAGTNTYNHYNVVLNALVPAGYPSLVVFYLGQINTFGSTLNAASFGVTQVSLAAVGLTWIIVPILISFLVGRRRD